MILSPADRKLKIDSYGSAYTVLVEGLKEFPREMWTFKPKDGWSIHQIVVHIADSEANSFVRCRRLVAEPGSTVPGYDEMVWARVLDYETQSPDVAVELFKWLRRASYDLIKKQPDSIGTHTVVHTESGLMTFDDWLDVYDRHIPEHVAQMRRVHEEWQASRQR